MDLSKKTKAELIEIITTQPNLQSIIDEKDKELVRMRIQYDEDLKAQKKAFIEEAAPLRKELDELKAVNAGQVINENKILKDNNRRIMNFISNYMSRYRAFLGTVQGSLELAVELESAYNEQFNSEFVPPNLQQRGR